MFFIGEPETTSPEHALLRLLSARKLFAQIGASFILPTRVTCRQRESPYFLVAAWRNIIPS
jgi:hypothetical protein